MYIVITTNNINNDLIYKSYLLDTIDEAKQELNKAYESLLKTLTNGKTLCDLACEIKVNFSDEMIKISSNDSEKESYKIQIIEITTESQKAMIDKKEKFEEMKKDLILTCKHCGKLLEDIYSRQICNRTCDYRLVQSDYNNNNIYFEFKEDYIDVTEHDGFYCENCHELIDEEQEEELMKKYGL